MNWEPGLVFWLILDGSISEQYELNESYLLQSRYSCRPREVACFSYCIPSSQWKLPDSVTVFLLLNESYLIQLLYSCCSMKVTWFGNCTPAVQWKLPVSVTVFLLSYERYLIQLLHFCLVMIKIQMQNTFLWRCITRSTLNSLISSYVSPDT